MRQNNADLSSAKGTGKRKSHKESLRMRPAPHGKRKAVVNDTLHSSVSTQVNKRPLGRETGSHCKHDFNWHADSKAGSVTYQLDPSQSDGLPQISLQNSHQRRNNTVACLFCQSNGHQMRNCPSLRADGLNRTKPKITINSISNPFTMSVDEENFGIIKERPTSSKLQPRLFKILR
ncbi:unnamed protein product [Calicophoron daubneyi]|uniref:CCHC-type domain-containing protein n=1 Tax=Calicophoron daubneyi TaxID=300641 RepID=A0AAV2T1W6_CALDB